jgi:hypothetical protein
MSCGTSYDEDSENLNNQQRTALVASKTPKPSVGLSGSLKQLLRNADLNTKSFETSCEWLASVNEPNPSGQDCSWRRRRRRTSKRALTAGIKAMMVRLIDV